MMSSDMRILTFDIEDWFHILDNDSTKTEVEWNKFPSRLQHNLETIFRILDENDTKASFFILGWIAEKHPQLIKEISNKGYEIGSHSYFHQLVYEQKPEEFKEDLKRSIFTLEDAIGKKVKMYRAPGFSITEQTKWAFEILLEFGIEIDSSIFPAKRGHGGYPSYGEARPSLIELGGSTIKEFPINTVSVLNKDLIYSGGGYFRIAPYSLIRRWTKQSNYVMTYFHPRDFDPDQPMVPNLPLNRKIKSYVGLKKCEAKFVKWISEFDFVDLHSADNQVDWSKAPVVKL